MSTDHRDVSLQKPTVWSEPPAHNILCVVEWHSLLWYWRVGGGYSWDRSLP